MGKVKFSNKKKSEYDETYIHKNTYKLLIVDDEENVHKITEIALKSMDFVSFDIKIISAYSGKEARKILKQQPDIAMALVDVVMETPEAGLELVNYIRHKLKNQDIRLIIRTGQANSFPHIDVVKRYDINDFKEKTELTLERLYTTIRSSIKQYQQIKELKRQHDEVYRQLTTNPVTKLPNRLKLIEQISSYTRQTLILIDIVSFSVINEVNGYEVGDTVLKELGAFLAATYSDTFDVYHLHSDLFGLIANEHNMDTLPQMVEQIKDDISKLHILTNNFNKTIDTTIGVAYQADENVIKKAELALKEARQQGRNKIQFYKDDLKVIKEIERIHHWAPIIKNAIEKHKLIPYYQPIYDLHSGEIVKYELLARLIDGNTIYTPNNFLDVAKSAGYFLKIFQVMFEYACKMVAKHKKRFSVNIGDQEFKSDTLILFISEMIHIHNIDPSYITLEILEYNTISDETIKTKINQIHSLGIQFAVDDFGVNCSNFAQIENLPINAIKIDGSFIKNLTTSKNSHIIVKTIKTFAKEKGIKLVAEFICNEDVLQRVKEFDIEYGQGFHLAEPQPEEMIKF